MTDEELYERLAAVTGYILNQPELLAEWSRDWWPYAARFDIEEANLPAFAVMPDAVAEVAAIVGIAREFGREIMLKGGGTNLTGALESRPGAILLDLRGLNVIEAVNEIDSTVRVDAGVHGGELEERLNELGYTLGHFPRSLNLSTVGGWLATRASGAFATKYGGIDTMIQGIDLVLMDGTISTVASTPIAKSGPIWTGLFAGAEGAFGVVTAVTLRVRPLPETRTFRAFSLPTYESGLTLLRDLVQRGVVPAAVSLHDRTESDALAFELNLPEVEQLLILAFEGPRRLVGAEESLCVEAFIAGGARDLGSEPGERWFELAYQFDFMVDGNEPDGAIADEIDVTAPWSAIQTVIDAGRAALEPLVQTINVHTTAVYPTGAMAGFAFTIQKRTDDDAVIAYQRAWRNCLDAVVAAGGAIGHHNGIGQVRLPWFENEQGIGMRVLRAVKAELDPGHLLNRGRLGLPPH